MTTRERIRNKAFELGFSKVGFADPGTPEGAPERLAEWLARGYHASMGWMERTLTKRTDPVEVVPGVRTIISLALNYSTGIQHRSDPGTGKISRYAWGDDYHEVVGGMLFKLWSWIEAEFPGVEGRYYVDTGPVMEKVWAQQAGIGWIGKHSNLITQDMGSWVFLAEILTSLEIEADSPGTDHCGTCTLCIDACPTRAIVEPYVVDSNRCISYLTIEHRGEFTADLPLDGWIYGCDVCQDVCPWNERFAVESAEPRFQPRDGNVSPSLEEWASMDDKEFSERFRGSSIKRTKREGLVRNINAVVSEQTGG
jgi:epoxyqueuosine reductase